MRIRPVLMTVITEFAGLLPIFIFDGLGRGCDAPYRATDGRRHDHHHHLNPDRDPGRLHHVGRQAIPQPHHG